MRRRHGPVVLFGAIAFVVFLVLQYRWFPHLSKNNDEPVYLFQSELLRSGHLTLPTSAVGGGLRPWMSGVIGDRTVLVFPPGWPAVLAVATVLLPFKVVGALAATFGLVAVYLLGIELLRSRAAALVAAAFVGVSPLMLVLGGTVLSYPFALGLGAVLVTATVRAGRTGRTSPLVVAGAASGLLFAVRPLDALLVTGVAGLHLVWTWRRRLPTVVRGAGLALAGAAPFVAGVLAVNARTTGSPLRFPLHANGGDNRFGFGPRQISAGARVFDVTPAMMERTTLRLLGELPHWTLGGLLVVPLVVWGAVRVARRRPSDVPLLVVLGLAFPAAYLFYWGSHFVHVGRRDYGPFYYLPVLVPIGLAVGEGLVGVARRSRLAALLVGVALLATLPASLTPKYRRAERHNLAVAREVRLVDALPRRSLVLLPGSNDGPWMLHVRGYFRNPPDLGAGRLYAADNGGANLDLADRFGDRPVYQLYGVLPGDRVFGDPKPVVTPLHQVSGAALRIESSFTNRTENPTVVSYVGVPDGFVRCVLDEESVSGRTYEATWTLTPAGPVPPDGCEALPPVLVNGQRLGANLVVGFERVGHRRARRRQPLGGALRPPHPPGRGGRARSGGAAPHLGRRSGRAPGRLPGSRRRRARRRHHRRAGLTSGGSLAHAAQRPSTAKWFGRKVKPKSRRRWAERGVNTSSGTSTTCPHASHTRCWCGSSARW